MPAGDTWTLEEQIHLRAVSLANVKVGECHIKVQTARPQRVHPRYLGDTPILPSMTERVTDKLMADSEYSGPVEDVDKAISARQERLLAIGKPPDLPPEPDGFADIAAKLRRRRKAEDGDA